MSEELFIRMINGSASEAEKIDFYKEMEINGDLKERFFHFKTIYAVTAATRISSNDHSIASFDRIWSRLNPERRLSIHDLWYRYAAIFVVAMGLGLLVQYMAGSSTKIPVYTQQINYSSERGAVSTIHLEDGSSIWLSSGSRISITKTSNGEMSAVLNGEAYFEMVPDPHRNFVVDLGFFKVKDIGTKFDIRAYKEEQVINVALAEGQVDFCQSSAAPMLSLKPGEYLQFNKQSNHMAVSRQDPSIATAWKEGKFVFIHKTLGEICHELESWYNVEIVISDKALANTRYTSVIKRTTTVKLVLQMLSLTDKINYKITDRKEDKDFVYIY
jgi:ferric-dicitrate binding protein FerR (iron transport regulator)